MCLPRKCVKSQNNNKKRIIKKNNNKKKKRELKNNQRSKNWTVVVGAEWVEDHEDTYCVLGVKQQRRVVFYIRRGYF